MDPLARRFAVVGLALAAAHLPLACAGGLGSSDTDYISGQPTGASSKTSGQDDTDTTGDTTAGTEGDTEGSTTWDWTTNGVTSDPYPTVTTTVEPTTSTTEETTEDTTGLDTESSSTTEPMGCDDCNTPPGPCYQQFGQCVANNCVYPPLSEGDPCDGGDACMGMGTCDGQGTCTVGEAMNCEAPHATGSCQNGMCSGWQCTGSWENCDGDWGNGCEIPTGVANKCDANGISDSGCWTAYCGQSNDPKAKNFGGNFYCMDCNNCHEPQNGFWQWCNHSAGTWYPAEAGGPCGSFKDVVCS